MRPERLCDDIRPDLSARLDGEVDAATDAALDEHLATCAACRAYEADLRRVRQALRLAPAEDVPDLGPRIMDAVRAERRAGASRREWKARLRTAAVAAAATAALLLGVGAPWVERPADVAGAGDIVAGVKAAARALTSYRATYRIIERGWHERIAARRMVAKVWFEAPESFRIEIADDTAYPGRGWPRNDVSIIAGPHRYWLSEPASCPVETVPDCIGGTDRREYTETRRTPFDGSSRFPTDIAVPLETVAAARGFDVEDMTAVAGRQAVHLELAYRDAVPLVASLQGGGSWRPFHPFDRVDLWIDASTWFPLRWTISAADTAERAAWADANGLGDRPDEVLLDVRATSFLEPGDIAPSVFRAPVSGTVTSDDFRPGGVDILGGDAPRYLAGLDPYRAGRSSGATLLAYARGLNWLRVTISRGSAAESASADPSVADEVRLSDRSYGYYRPAQSGSSRSVEVYGRARTVHLESNLARDRLLAVAASLPLEGRRVDPAPGTARVDPGSLPRFALTPGYLPEGYTPAGADAAVVRGPGGGAASVLLYFRSPEAEYDGVGIRIAQTRGARLAPTSEEVVGVSVHGHEARWSAERSELEWIDDGVYRAVSAPSFDLGTALAIARSLR